MDNDDFDCCGECEDCDLPEAPPRDREFIQMLVDTVYGEIHRAFGPPDKLSDEDFETVSTAVLSLISTTLNHDLEVFDLSDIGHPPPDELN
jgi:hypothetical protein